MGTERCEACGKIVLPGRPHDCAAKAAPPASPVAPATAPAARPRVPPWLIVVLAIAILGGWQVIYMLGYLDGDAVVFVDNSLTVQAAVTVDGKPVGKVFPGLYERFAVPAGKRAIAGVDPKGVVLDQVQADLAGGEIYIFNPGGTRDYEIRKVPYSSVGVSGDSFETRWLPAGRWHHVRDVDHVLEPLPDRISGSDRSYRTQLTRVMTKK